MTPEAAYNALPEGFEGEQKRRTEFDSAEEKLSYDAKGLIAKTKKEYNRKIVTVADAFDLRSREDDQNTEALRRAIASEIKNPEEVEVDERLMSLVVNPIKEAHPDGVHVQGKRRTAEEIAQAIPNVEAFLAEVDLQKQYGILLDFFELNEEGQLVMKDDCEKPYGLGENARQARIRQTRIVYEGEDGQTQVMTGEEYFNVTERDGEGRPVAMEVSQDALRIDQETIQMERGLAKLKFDGNTHSGEFDRMQSPYWTWTDDKALVKDDGSPDFARARPASWDVGFGRVFSYVFSSYGRADLLGSRGVLRVNLNFES